MLTQRQMLGRWGERLAATWLQRQGYVIVAQNYRCRYGELDIVAERKGILYACEVKTRRSVAFGNPEEAVTQRKRDHMRRTAAHFLAHTAHRSCVATVFLVCAISVQTSGVSMRVYEVPE